MLPHYVRQSDVPTISANPAGEVASGLEDGAIDNAAAALRAAELEAVQADLTSNEIDRLDEMSIDELRQLAAELDVPDRGQIIEQDKLIAAIQQRMFDR